MRVLALVWVLPWLCFAQDRVAGARAREGATVVARLREVGLTTPPASVLLRVFKSEGVLEVWAGAAAGPLQRLWSLPICARSGELGPKRVEGDEQVPEGVYRITRFNPWSAFHLSLGLDYPNAADRARTPGAKRGGDIFIHGGCATIGCVPLGDAAIERVYLLAADAHARGVPVDVLMLPSRMDDARWQWLLSRAPEGDPRRALWTELRAVDRAFESQHRLPRVIISPAGAYRLDAGRARGRETAARASPAR